MNCPACRDVILVIAERQGIEIDYCPKCRGVWLDRGELDKIIERSAPYPEASVPDDPRGSGWYRDDDDYKRFGKFKKKRGFLGELFDFD